MKQRHLFIMSFTAAVVLLAGFSSVNLALHSRHQIQETATVDESDMIGCLTGDVDLEQPSGDPADVRGRDIIFSAGFDRDLARQRCSAFIIDKQLIGKGAWDAYAEFLDEFHDDTPLMIVDNITDWIMSSNMNRKS